MSNNILNFFIILFFYEYIDLINTSCPPDLIIKPCLCIHETPDKNFLSPLHFEIISADEKLVLCENIHNSSFNLQEVFVKLSSYSNIISNDDQNATYFNYFILSNTSLTSIPENVFVNITFRSLMLRNNFQLTTIHKNAFSSGKDYVESFETMNTSLSDTETIFSIIKQFENLRHLSMQNDRLKFIPSYAFNHTYLTNVYFGSEGSLSQTQPIESIGDYAFYNLPNLYLLRIFSPNLTKISKYAFARRKRFVLYDDGPNMLHLYIGGEGLNSTSFELTSLNRFRNYHVFLRLYYTSITYLDEKIFQPFLESNPFSAISIDRPIGCDCRSAWIQYDYFKNIDQMDNRVYGYNCWDYDFTNCTIDK